MGLHLSYRLRFGNLVVTEQENFRTLWVLRQEVKQPGEMGGAEESEDASVQELEKYRADSSDLEVRANKDIVSSISWNN